MRWLRVPDTIAPRPVTPALPAFDEAGLERVVADPLRFKQHLKIGEEAFALLRAKKHLFTVWETAGAAATGAGVASSSIVAGSFFAPTGLAAWLGLATAATPVGWIVAAAFVAGGGYYGVSRWFSGKTDDFVDTIPKYITTPIDLLGAALFDLMGKLAMRVAAIDGRIDPTERAFVIDHFVQDWGFDPDYVARRLDALASGADETGAKALAKDLAQFLSVNPDCNASAIQAGLVKFLDALIAIDGVVDEREELILEAIERVFQDENRLTVAKVGETLADVSKSAASAASEAASRVGSTAKSLGNAISRKLTKAPDDTAEKDFP